jgi:hypothetical protein
MVGLSGTFISSTKFSIFFWFVCFSSHVGEKSHADIFVSLDKTLLDVLNMQFIKPHETVIASNVGVGGCYFLHTARALPGCSFCTVNSLDIVAVFFYFFYTVFNFLFMNF